MGYRARVLTELVLYGAAASTILRLSPLPSALADEPQALETERTFPGPHEAVREGNQRLLGGDPTGALEAYSQARQTLPDSRELAFIEGLARYDLKELDEAREAFGRAVGSRGDALAADAMYSLGTCDHTEAFQHQSDPKHAVSLLESAMRRYHSVLANRPDHEYARDANLKAATMWRQLKELMQQQQQQEQQSEGDKQEDSEDQQRGEQQQEENNDAQQENQQQAESDRNEHEDPEEQREQSAAQKEEQVSREQAQRKLREMMQAIRDRKKARREQVKKVPIAPVDKDW